MLTTLGKGVEDLYSHCFPREIHLFIVELCSFVYIDALGGNYWTPKGTPLF